MTAVAIVAMTAMMAMVVDGGMMYLVRTRSQAAADAAALAAAAALPYGTQRMNSDAGAIAALNPTGGALMTIKVYNPPQGSSDTTQVEVDTSVTYSTFFARVLGLSTATIASRAIAQLKSASSTFNPFSLGIFGKQFVTDTGNGNTDSYDSSKGSYQSQIVNGFAGDQGNVGSDGNITLTGNGTFHGSSTAPGTLSMSGNATINTNATAGGAVTMNGNATITGNLITNGALSTSGNAIVQGSTTQNAGITIPAPTLPPVDTSGAAASNNNANISPPSALSGSPPSLSVSGNGSVTLPGGVYYLNSISVSGNGVINVTGPSVIYVTTSISISGNGFTNTTQNPDNLIIEDAGTSSVHWSGNANFYGGLYAPGANLAISGNGEAYGGYVAGSITNSGNGAIHLDKNLSLNLNVPGGQVYRLTQ